MATVDAIANLNSRRPVYGRVIAGEYYDTGNKLGWISANIEFALRDVAIGAAFAAHLKRRLEREQSQTDK